MSKTLTNPASTTQAAAPRGSKTVAGQPAAGSMREWSCDDVLLLVFAETGQRSAHRVSCSKLSQQAVQLRHRNFLHAGTKCQVLLPLRDSDKRLLIEAHVADCRPAQNNQHDVHIQFDDTIDLKMIVS